MDGGIGQDAVERRGREAGAVLAEELGLEPLRAEVALTSEREDASGEFVGPLGVGEAVGPPAPGAESGVAFGGEPPRPFAEGRAGDAAAPAGEASVAGLSLGLDPGAAGLEGLRGVCHGAMVGGSA